MGKYGLDWNKDIENFTDKDWAVLLAETTKIITAKIIRTEKDVLEVGFAFYDRGIYYDCKGEYDKAIADYTSAIERIIDFAHGYYNRGLTYWDMKQYNKALDNFNEALRLIPKVAPPDAIEKDIQRTRKCIKRIIEEMNS